MTIDGQGNAPQTHPLLAERVTQALVRDGLNLGQAGEPSQRLDLDLTDALSRQAKPAADLLQRLWLVVVEAVAEHEHLPLALAERGQHPLERLAAQGELDQLVREEPLVGDEVAEDGVLPVADRLIEARRPPRPGPPDRKSVV